MKIFRQIFPERNEVTQEKYSTLLNKALEFDFDSQISHMRKSNWKWSDKYPTKEEIFSNIMALGQESIRNNQSESCGGNTVNFNNGNVKIDFNYDFK